jgi:AAA15 family ATPase/GTPase
MLKSIQLENFKAFGQRTIIPLAPITLIIGQNSSGKSSILQSLNLLMQTRESRDADALLLAKSRKWTDLFTSTYSQLVCDIRSDELHQPDTN